jgi:hypothetical protein
VLVEGSSPKETSRGSFRQVAASAAGETGDRSTTLNTGKPQHLTMRVRGWKDIVEEVVESDGDPEEWRAVAGDRSSGVGEDLYVGHPTGGVFQMKTYARNPFEVEGVGARVARKVDGDLDPLFPEWDDGGRFAVQSPPEDEEDAERSVKELEEVLKAHAAAPTDPDHLFEDVMEAVDSPAFGPMDYEFDERPAVLDDLAGTFEDAESVLETEFEELVEEDGVGRGFH